jgi:hypothetical protein
MRCLFWFAFAVAFAVAASRGRADEIMVKVTDGPAAKPGLMERFGKWNAERPRLKFVRPAPVAAPMPAAPVERKPVAEAVQVAEPKPAAAKPPIKIVVERN